MPHHFEDQDRQGNSFMLGLMAGTAIGAGIALLIAPREGAAMRRDLSESAHRLGEKLSHGAGSVRQTARRAADTASDLIERGRSAYSDASKEARHAADRGADRLDTAVESAADSARRTVNQAAGAVEHTADRVQSGV